MSETKTLVDLGGPVFPQETHNADGSTSVWFGMNLRDLFAAAAMQGLLSSGGPVQPSPSSGWGFVNCNASTVAGMAYELADAMLAARERKEESK